LVPVAMTAAALVWMALKQKTATATSP
jgi:hypothetical protein